MRLYMLAMSAAIATFAVSQSSTLAQEKFRTPTHPTLSELTGAEATPAPTSYTPMPPAPDMQPLTGQLPMGQSMTPRQSFFSYAPRLVRTATSEQGARTPATYEFTIAVPMNAGQALQAVRIVQDQNLETVQFDLSRSQAFDGMRYAAGPAVALVSQGGNQPTPGEVTIVFAQPVQPGHTVTVALESKANPNGGVYEFGVTAFPVGSNQSGQFLGYGRLSFLSGSD